MLPAGRRFPPRPPQPCSPIPPPGAEGRYRRAGRLKGPPAPRRQAALNKTARPSCALPSSLPSAFGRPASAPEGTGASPHSRPGRGVPVPRLRPSPPAAVVVAVHPGGRLSCRSAAPLRGGAGCREPTSVSAPKLRINERRRGGAQCPARPGPAPAAFRFLSSRKEKHRRGNGGGGRAGSPRPSHPPPPPPKPLPHPPPRRRFPGQARARGRAHRLAPGRRERAAQSHAQPRRAGARARGRRGWRAGGEGGGGKRRAGAIARPQRSGGGGGAEERTPAARCPRPPPLL